MTALTKSLCPWNLFVGFRVERDHDQTDLSQQPANTVSVFGDTATDVRGAVGPAYVAETLFVCMRKRQSGLGRRPRPAGGFR